MSLYLYFSATLFYLNNGQFTGKSEGWILCEMKTDVFQIIEVYLLYRFETNIKEIEILQLYESRLFSFRARPTPGLACEGGEVYN